jgi:hypothetical protein
MCGTAAHLTDHVLPDVHVRQWVLSVPYELRLLLARVPRVLSAVGRIFVTEIFRWQREQAGLHGVRGARGGAICFPQRFGGSLNLNVHFHVAVPDGVFTVAEGAERADFHALPPPAKIDLDTLALNVELRVLAWLRRRGLLANDGDDAPGEAAERSALEACLAGSLGLGELTALRKRRIPAPDEHERPLRVSKSARRGGHSRGFDIHAGVVVAGGDREGRERLLRYCARPPLRLERLGVLPDGRVAYEIRKPWGHQTHRVMTPVAFLARLAALIPPPRHPLVRFFGVLAPHAAWRKKIVPVRTGCSPENDPRCVARREPDAPRAVKQEAAPSGASVAGCTVLANLTGEPTASVTCSPAAAPVHAAPHSLRSPSARIDWAELLKRVHRVDALACPCGGRLQFIALILEEATARAILGSVGLPTEPPPIARARSPDCVDVPAYDDG